MIEAGLSIGGFSRAASISVNTLRKYHEIGLLVPASIDPQTGYRRYATDQLADALIVVRLRDLDVPLAMVKEVLEARNPALTRTILERHGQTMRERLAATERIVNELHDGLAPDTLTPVHVREVPARHTVRIIDDVPNADVWAWLGHAHSRLRTAVEKSGMEPIGVPSARYLPSIEQDDSERVEAYLEVDEPLLLQGDHPVAIAEVPAQAFAVLVHRGSFDSVGDTYRALGAWVSRNADSPGPERSEEKIVEHYLDGTAGAADATNRIEICWPISRAGG